MFDNPLFQHLVEQDRPTGEVCGVNRFLVKVKGLEGVPAGALILFENGGQGTVREAGPDGVTVLNFSSEDTPLGMLAVLQEDRLTVGVGEALVGRVVSALGQPLDGKGPLNLTASQPVFGGAPGITERSLLTDQLVTGVAAVDMMFPIVLGQRIAVLGDAKSGKSTFLTQMTVSQKDTGRVVIYVLISKRKVDIDNLIGILETSGAIKHTIVVVASVFDSLAQSYLAPYAAVAMGEYLWAQGRDVVMVYDDLSNHAKIYREMALLGRTYPGRDSYPGDMFYAHSSLLERAGKLASSGKTLTAIPVIVTPNDDITAYLPTSIMSITDGQIIFDMSLFRQGIRPAVSAGLSVSRVGGRAQSARQKELTGRLFKKLAAYRQANEFSHFGSELAVDSQSDLELGKWIYEVLKQLPQELYSLTTQELSLAAVLETEGKRKLNVDSLKHQAAELGGLVTTDNEFTPAVKKLVKDNSLQVAKK
ncbi:sodium-transporting two-sector ATPase [Candidatus Parcubacteria bacterium]|nr:sodium-transporting two-sector ATPase [Candidatus Parcubacteria bacterium]